MLVSGSQCTMRYAARRALHASAVRQLTIPFLPVLPQKPGGVKGTPNDSYVPPRPDRAHGNMHWWTEKTFQFTAVPLATVAFLSTGPLSTVADTAFCLSALGYSCMEFQSCIIDYVQLRVYGKWHNYAMYLLGAGTIVSLFGIYKLEAEGDGLTGTLRSWWHGKKSIEKH